MDTTRFCNKFVYLQSIPGFAEIIGIVEFYWNGAVVNGIFVERLSTLGNAFKARHIHNILFLTKYQGEEKRLYQQVFSVTSRVRARESRKRVPKIHESIKSLSPVSAYTFFITHFRRSMGFLNSLRKEKQYV